MLLLLRHTGWHAPAPQPEKAAQRRCWLATEQPAPHIDAAVVAFPGITQSANSSTHACCGRRDARRGQGGSNG
jgi:hypothetical protein